MTDSKADYLSVSDAAALLDVHTDTVRRLIRSGKLEAVRIGRIIRISRAVLEESLEPAAPWAVA